MYLSIYLAYLSYNLMHLDNVTSFYLTLNYAKHKQCFLGRCNNIITIITIYNYYYYRLRYTLNCYFALLSYKH